MAETPHKGLLAEALRPSWRTLLRDPPALLADPPGLATPPGLAWQTQPDFRARSAKLGLEDWGPGNLAKTALKNQADSCNYYHPPARWAGVQIGNY